MTSEVESEYRDSFFLQRLCEIIPPLHLAVLSNRMEKNRTRGALAFIAGVVRALDGDEIGCLEPNPFRFRGISASSRKRTCKREDERAGKNAGREGSHCR